MAVSHFVQPLQNQGHPGGNISMPVISMFFGIVIRMYHREHGLLHVHAEYQGQEATIDFDGSVRQGQLQSRTALREVRE